MESHSCFKKVNKELAKHNTRLVIDLLHPTTRVFIQTQKINGNGKAKQVIATYCPFCGEKMRID